MGMIIGRSLTPLPEDMRAVRRRETVRRCDDDSRRKVHNLRGDSCDGLAEDKCSPIELAELERMYTIGVY